MSGPDDSERLRMAIANLERKQDLDERGPQILDLLTINRWPVLFGLFQEMIEKAHTLIGSIYYVDIIQKMTGIYKTLSNKPKEGPLNYLLQQFDDTDKTKCLCAYQENLLNLIQILISIDDSPASRTKCLRVLIANSRYALWNHEGMLWTTQLVGILNILLSDGADPTWSPARRQESALFTFIRILVHSLVNADRLFGALKELLPLVLTGRCLNHTEDKCTILHALVYWTVTLLPESIPCGLVEMYETIRAAVDETSPNLLERTAGERKTALHLLIKHCSQIHANDKETFVDLVICLISSANKDIQDAYGQTALHILFRQYSAVNDKDLICNLCIYLVSSSNIDFEDKNGQTVLHILASEAVLHPDGINGMQLLFKLLVTNGNVNSKDVNAVTPYSWISVGKASSEDCNHDVYRTLSDVDEMFRSKGADPRRTRLTFVLFKWLDQELCELHGKLCRLQELLNFMNGCPALNSRYCCRALSENAFKNLERISNAKYVPIIISMIKILIASEETSNHVWHSLLKRLNYLPYVLPPSPTMEILCLCAERGVQPTDDEQRLILALASQATARDEIVATYLKILIAMQETRRFTCDLDSLGDLYIISKDIIAQGGELSQLMYRTQKQCLASNCLINYLLYVSHGQERQVQFDESFHERLLAENWLKRNHLHLAVTLIDNEDTLKCLPKALIDNYINARDIHGRTPLHIALLHRNHEAAKFLISHGAQEDLNDYYGLAPKEMFSIIEQQADADAQFLNLCQRVMKAESNLREHLRPLMIFPDQEEIKVLSEQMMKFFECLAKKTNLFKDAQIHLAGSMRERLKCCQLDEYDLQLRVAGQTDDDGRSISIAGVKKSHTELKTELEEDMKEALADYKEGGNFVVISIRDPWKIIWLKDGAYRGLISVDVVLAIVQPEDDSYWADRRIVLHGNQLEILQDAPGHSRMKFAIMDNWKSDNMKTFDATLCEYGWDLLDSLPVHCRLAVVMAKSLVEAYDVCNKEKKWRVKLPITSFTIKTALFYILASRSSRHLEFLRQLEMDCKKRADALTIALEKFHDIRGRREEAKLKHNPHPRWLTDADVTEAGEDARIVAIDIFTLIKCLAEDGWMLISYWNRSHPVTSIAHALVRRRYGEKEFILDICDCVLNRLDARTFHASDSDPQVAAK